MLTQYSLSLSLLDNLSLYRSNMDNCNLDCLDRDSFQFPGSNLVTTVTIQSNNFAKLPEELLWHMESLLFLFARNLVKLTNLPEQFFLNQSNLLGFFFTSSFLLGAQGLPDGLYKGLNSLVYLGMGGLPLLNAPNMDDLTAMTTWFGQGTKGRTIGLDSMLSFSDREGETKFDHLVSCNIIILTSNRLTRIPSLKNMGSLTQLELSSNKITRIAPGDFEGATQLVVLDLSNNNIVSIADSAFFNLAALRFTVPTFQPTNDVDGSPFTALFNEGLLANPDLLGSFGGNKTWKKNSISLAPNPIECLWVGPLLINLVCSTCGLGYELEQAAEGLECVKPPSIRPHKGWVGSSEQNLLKIQDTSGNAVKELMKGHTYTIPPPRMEPKDIKFVGYEQPFSKIHYELDFSRGSDVDIGCGSDVDGDGLHDAKISKSVVAHPLSRDLWNYQMPGSHGNRNADPPDPGNFMSNCPRYHRFKVTKPGNFTFDSCSSAMTQGISIMRQTGINISNSEPSMNITTGRFNGRGGLYEVPLHDNNIQYRTFSTGLIDIEPDLLGPGMERWLNAPGRPNPFYPRVGQSTKTGGIYFINGCPLSASVRRTIFLEVGDYIIESQAAFMTLCGDFHLKMICSGGAETASPADSDPLGFSVDVKTGAITGTPKKVRKGYKMRLRAVDAANKRTDVAEWTFDVKEPPAFALNPDAGWLIEKKGDGKLESKYHVNETHLLSKPRVKTTELLQNPASGAFNKVLYALSAVPDEHNLNCTQDGEQAISATTDVVTGAGAMNIQCEGNYTAKLVVRDSAGSNVEVRSWRFEALVRDTLRPEYGPNKRGCEHGDAEDGEPMDRAFTCEVCDSQYTGENCETLIKNTTSTYAAIGVILFLVCVAAVYAFYYGNDRRRRIGMARKAAEQSNGATKTELTDGLLAAVEFGELGLVPALIKLGADASVRGLSGQLPHATALRHELQLDNDVHLAALQALFHAHCEFDAQIGTFLKSNSDGSTSSDYVLVEHVISELARSAWRSPLTGNTVAHVILEGCYKLNMAEKQTVRLMQAVLLHDATILTTANERGKTPTDVAIMCEGMVEIQTRFTVVLFNRYQIVRPQHPLYKSPTAEVHECNDLTQLRNMKHNSNSDARYVIKLMANPDLWLRELQTRDTLGLEAADSYVGATSAAIAEHDVVQSLAETEFAAAQAAMQYAVSASSKARPVSVFKPSFVAENRRDEARLLMTEYPYAIQMRLADRNLSEIIASERLAEQPLDAIRRSSRKVLNLINDLHNEGVVHGDVKPKNVVRVDRTLMLIDLDMSITIGSSEPPAHANPEKFGGSTAYAAPELHQWMAEHKGWGFVDDGSTPVERLETPQQIDLWSFAVTLYEMVTGSPLFSNSYDRATPAALAKLKNWAGLDTEQLSQIESLHGAAESASLRDVLMWALDAHATNRPQSVAELAAHAFFDPRGGAMRANFAVNEIKQLLIASPLDSSARVDVNVMISYCWGDTDFVLSRLAVEVAPRVCSLWLDRLGGEQGMGEFARASMQRGVENADVIIAVVSPSYIASANCGYEMEMAHKYGKPVIPVVLNVPFQEWPPQQIGQTKMNEQFATAAGDVKIFVDMSDPQKFFQKFKQELLPRLKSKLGVLPTTISRPVRTFSEPTSRSPASGSILSSHATDASNTSELNAALESDDAGKIVAPKSGVHRPKKGSVVPNDAYINVAAVHAGGNEMEMEIRITSGAATSDEESDAASDAASDVESDEETDEDLEL